jgi:citrate synthase
MLNLRQKLRKQIPELRKQITGILKEHSDVVISNVTVKQFYGGMRGVVGLACNTSYVDPMTGLHIRGIPIIELTDKIPEEIFYLLCTGELPDASALRELQEGLKLRAEVPEYIWDVLYALPKETHPMTMFSIAVMALEGNSVFKQKYATGLRKADFWEATLDDSLELIAKLPAIAAAVYRIRFSKGELLPYDYDLDWAGNYAKMLGIPDPKGKFTELMRLYLVLHCDHEGGNVSAFTARVVNSALSNIYLASSAGLNGLAGPLHGLANQECLKFVHSIQEKFNGVPSKEQLEEFVWSTLNVGKVIPGYGHAVLRQTDPRFTAFFEFGKKYCLKDDMFQIVKMLYEVVPGILKQYGSGKVANPYPNVDAASGCLLYHYGLSMFDYYTVLFGVSRVLGFCAQAIMARGLQAPIIRPKTATNEWIQAKIKEVTKK